MSFDTVFSDRMKPVFTGEPAEVHRRLKARYPDDWTVVYIGASRTVTTIPEYLYKDKLESVIEMIRELLRKQGLPVYLRDPSRFDTYIERVARKIIEKVPED